MPESIIAKDFAWFTTIVDDFDAEILKAGFHKAIKKYPKKQIMEGLIDSKFWEKYAGVSVEKSKQINDILLKAVLSGKWRNKDYLVRAIVSVGVPHSQAEMIAKTELANLANRVREYSYKEWTRVQKFVWVTENDNNVCEKCKEMERRTAHGVTLDEMKKLIKEVGGETAREYVLHPACRCTFTRKIREGRIRIRHWE